MEVAGAMRLVGNASEAIGGARSSIGPELPSNRLLHPPDFNSSKVRDLHPGIDLTAQTSFVPCLLSSFHILSINQEFASHPLAFLARQIMAPAAAIPVHRLRCAESAAMPNISAWRTC